MTTQIPVLPMFECPTTPAPCSRLARRRRLSDGLLTLGAVLALVALIAGSLVVALPALLALALGARLSPRLSAYVDLGRVEWL